MLATTYPRLPIKSLDTIRHSLDSSRVPGGRASQRRPLHWSIPCWPLRLRTPTRCVHPASAPLASNASVSSRTTAPAQLQFRLGSVGSHRCISTAKNASKSSNTHATVAALIPSRSTRTGRSIRADPPEESPRCRHGGFYDDFRVPAMLLALEVQPAQEYPHIPFQSFNGAVRMALSCLLFSFHFVGASVVGTCRGS